MFLSEVIGLASSLGSTSVEVYEWDEATVKLPRLPKSSNFSSLCRKRPDLVFSGWSLAHAVVKADYLDKRNLTLPGLGFLLQAGSVMDFGAPSLALKSGASKKLNDVSLSSLAGRVGQGFAILYGHSLGMRFEAHLHSHVESLQPGSAGTAHKDEAMADFLFTNGQQTVLMESKGSFTLKDNNPSAIKSVLKNALVKQVDPWMGYLNPAPGNGYAIYSCVRENTWSPSALFVVDPEGEDSEGADVPFSAEEVIRENYAAWLRVMGLPGAAGRLAQRSSDVSEPEKRDFYVADVRGRSFAFSADEVPLRNPFRLWNPFVGIDLEVLRAISAAIESGSSTLLDSLTLRPDQTGRSLEYASIFPDGSIFGVIDHFPARAESLLL